MCLLAAMISEIVMRQGEKVDVVIFANIFDAT